MVEKEGGGEGGRIVLDWGEGLLPVEARFLVVLALAGSVDNLPVRSRKGRWCCSIMNSKVMNSKGSVGGFRYLSLRTGQCEAGSRRIRGVCQSGRAEGSGGY